VPFHFYPTQSDGIRQNPALFGVHALASPRSILPNRSIDPINVPIPQTDDKRRNTIDWSFPGL
jgi:hypothetical protein